MAWSVLRMRPERAAAHRRPSARLAIRTMASSRDKVGWKEDILKLNPQAVMAERRMQLHLPPQVGLSFRKAIGKVVFSSLDRQNMYNQERQNALREEQPVESRPAFLDSDEAREWLLAKQAFRTAAENIICDENKVTASGAPGAMAVLQEQHSKAALKFHMATLRILEAYRDTMFWTKLPSEDVTTTTIAEAWSALTSLWLLDSPSHEPARMARGSNHAADISMASPAQWLTEELSRYSGSPPLESVVEPYVARSGEEAVPVNRETNAPDAEDDGLQMELDAEAGHGDSPFDPFRTDVYQRLAQIQENITQLHQTLQNHQRHTDTRLAAMMDSLQELANSQAKPPDDPRRAGPRRSREKGKDSRANYLRRCIRKHVGLTFGFRGTDSLPSPPSEQDIRSALALIDHGGRLQKPYRYDWRSPPTALYNVCVENAFSADFWASARGGQYDITLIPEDYQSREPFIDAYRRYMIYLKKCWSEQQQAPSAGQKAAKAKHYSRNSRIGTTFRNRRDAAQYLPIPESSQVYDIVSQVGQGRQYATFDKPWRASSLVHLYRHLDLVHAATRNPNGNPIRTGKCSDLNPLLAWMSCGCEFKAMGFDNMHVLY
ncbi:hypothetical protein C8T65DRAFT_696744 [Cerioporus squamosus]|nr:hypothetical protein C8T65DRAFT_696744 [Cerioporus squamosus]